MKNGYIYLYVIFFEKVAWIEKIFFDRDLLYNLG